MIQRQQCAACRLWKPDTSIYVHYDQKNQEFTEVKLCRECLELEKTGKGKFRIIASM